MSLFSFLKNTDSALLVFHDDALQVLQFKKNKDQLSLVGQNEIALEVGVVEKGNILNMEAFKQALSELFLQAEPKAIKANKLFVNVPYHLLYTYVEDFSHKVDKDSIKRSMTDTVKGHFPISLEELALDFHLTEKDHDTSAAVYASPGRWRERLLKACKSVGVDSIEYIPEPLCHMALQGEKTQEDVALFSCHQNQVYLSLFRNGLLHDSYFILSLDDPEAVQCFNCQQEFDKAQKDFFNQFGADLKDLYFVGFDKDYQSSIREHFGTSGQNITMIGSDHARLAELIPFDPQGITLFGLFNVVLSELG